MQPWIEKKTLSVKPREDLKENEVKALYNDLRVSCIHTLPEKAKDFITWFIYEQLEQACVQLEINAYIFQCDVDTIGKKTKPAGLIWQKKNS